MSPSLVLMIDSWCDGWLTGTRWRVVLVIDSWCDGWLTGTRWRVVLMMTLNWDGRLYICCCPCCVYHYSLDRLQSEVTLPAEHFSSTSSLLAQREIWDTTGQYSPTGVSDVFLEIVQISCKMAKSV